MSLNLSLSLNLSGKVMRVVYLLKRREKAYALLCTKRNGITPVKRNTTKENAPNAPRYISDEYFYARIFTLKLRCVFGTRMVKRLMVLARFCLCTKLWRDFVRKDFFEFFFPKGAHKQKHTKTRDDERQTNALFLGCYNMCVFCEAC